MSTVLHLLLAASTLAMIAAAPTSVTIGPDDHARTSAVTAADGPQEFAVAMGAVDPQIRAAHEAAGQDLPPPGAVTRTDRFEYLAYYPQVLQVHAGDRVRFLHEGFHTATFVADLEEQPAFLRRDEVDGVVAVDGSREPTDTSCVAHAVDVPADAPPCVLEGDVTGWTTGWNSALVEVRLPEGLHLYVCGIHDKMAGWIEVVPDDQPIAAPAEVERAGRELMAEDTTNAEAVLRAGEVPEVQVEDGTRVWTVRAGDFTSDGRVAIIRFLPSLLTVEPGDDVRFVVPDGPGHEVHTASFPADAYPLQIAHYFTGACDPDDPRTGAPGAPATLAVLVVGCPEPFATEIQLLPHAYRSPTTAPGNQVATPRTVHDSGWLTTPGWSRCLHACDPWTGERFPSEHRVSLGGEGLYSYVCNIHPERGMAAAIEVVAAAPR